ncbi:MAG: hypothetical protein ACSHW7_00615 [Patiriisocius sp.]|uniref:hypothetical protein n=1 Tax=Patiriisocius sp. TaxID=2822396 RepID=UPI003EF6C0B5
MKKSNFKILIWFTLSSFIINAQEDLDIDTDIDSVYFKDGSVETGEVYFKEYILEIDMFDEPTKRFDLNKVERIVKRRRGEETTFEVIYYEKRDRYLVLQKVLEGYMTLYRTTIDYTTNIIGFGNTSSTSVIYYYKKKNEQNLEHIDLKGFIGMGISVKKSVAFFKDCPKLVSKINNDGFGDNSIVKFVVFYNNNCN